MRIVRFTQQQEGGQREEGQQTGPRVRWGWIDDGDRIGHRDGLVGPDHRPADLELASVQLRAPVVPSKIIGVGRNYVAHASEHKVEVPEQPLLFLKPPSAVIGPGEVIWLPPQSERVEHEAELAVVIGRAGRWIDEADAGRHVLGYTVSLDVTARDIQRADPQWTRGKGFDTFCPLGPWIETELDLAAAEIRCTVNSELRQQGSPEQMVFSVAQLVAYTSTVMTLEPGDLILTGTPAGVGPLRDGDTISVSIEGIGEISWDVAKDPRGNK
jgi:2-keto-4-pentenoate hydratase/2-oxohepta-3-ene-1,7-dioic acid hydratase in catechol pathway